MEVWEASEWPSGKGSVSLGWAEAEDTLLPPLPGRARQSSLVA